MNRNTSPNWARTTNENLRLLGYRTESAKNKWLSTGKKHIIAPDGTSLGDYSASECSKLLAERHPEYFPKVRP